LFIDRAQVYLAFRSRRSRCCNDSAMADFFHH
jgi:hypothetical protein